MDFSVKGLGNSFNNVKNIKLNQVPGGKAVINMNTAADQFLRGGKTLQGTAVKNPGWLVKNANKPGFKQVAKLGNTFNGYVATGANKVGTNLLNKSGFIGKQLASMSAKKGLLGSIGTKLTGLATKLTGVTAKKIPGLGTLIAIGTGIVGVAKAAGKALKGDFRGAGRQLLQSAGTVGGMAAGLALMATGVGFLPGLALAVGAGVAGDWVGKKAADTLLPEKAAAQPSANPYGLNPQMDAFDAQIEETMNFVNMI